MNRFQSKDIRVQISYLDLRVSLVAEGCSWSPDVAEDMVNRMDSLWASALAHAVMFGLMSPDGDDDLVEQDSFTGDDGDSNG